MKILKFWIIISVPVFVRLLRQSTKNRILKINSRMSIRKYFATSKSDFNDFAVKKAKINSSSQIPIVEGSINYADEILSAKELLSFESKDSSSSSWTPYSELIGDWRVELLRESEKNYFIKLTAFLISEIKNHKIFPPSSYLFTAFNLCQLTDLKVVIIGQDPYHGKGQVKSSIYIF